MANPAGGVEPDVAPDQDRRAGGLVASGERVDPRDELGEGERLGQIVVGAEAEAVDPVLDRARRGQYEHA